MRAFLLVLLTLWGICAAQADDDKRYRLTLPASLGEASRLEPLVTTVSLLRVGSIIRLLPELGEGGGPRLSAALTLDRDGRAESARLRLLLADGTGPSLESRRALDGSYEVHRAGVRGAASMATESQGALHDGPSWLLLGKLLVPGRTTQTFTLMRELAPQPEVAVGTITLRSAGEATIRLMSGEVKARRWRYSAALALGLPPERRQGYFYLGPQGEVLRSDLHPEWEARAPAPRTEPLTLTLTDGSRWTVGASAAGIEAQWLMSGSAKPLVTELWSQDNKLLQVESGRAGTPLTVTIDERAVRFGYTALPPTFVAAPEKGELLYLPSLFLPELGAKLLPDQERSMVIVPLSDNRLVGRAAILRRLPDDGPRRRLRLTFAAGGQWELTFDTGGLIELTGTDGFQIVRLAP